MNHLFTHFLDFLECSEFLLQSVVGGMDYDIETVCCPSHLGNRLTGKWVRMSQKDRDTHKEIIEKYMVEHGTFVCQILF